MSAQELLRRQFTRMGARLRVDDSGARLFPGERVRLDVARDAAGEYFDFRHLPDLTAEVVDIRPAVRHLVLMVREGRDKNKFLLGHDERHWFAAAVPDDGVRDVRTAMESLRPAEAQGHGVIRQGEWFFVPVRDFESAGQPIHRQEPLSRGAGSKAHMCEELIRRGGVTVMVSLRYPAGVTLAEYGHLIGADPSLLRLAWRSMVREPEVFVRGKVRHSDHATILLDGWHRVYMNRERLARHSRQVAFLD
jgi:hypothetical protein